MVKNTPAKAGDTRDVGLIPGWGRFPGIGSDNPFKYSCLENSMDRGAWQAAVHGVTKRRLRLSYGAHTHVWRESMDNLFYLSISKYVFLLIRLHWVLAAACRIFRLCRGMQDLESWHVGCFRLGC